MGAQGDEPLAELPIPERYQQVTGLSGHASVVAHAYARFAADLRESTSTVPGFTHAVGVHQLLERITESASTGVRR